MAQQRGACEHQYLAGNCPYCEIVRLRRLLLEVHREREWLADRLESVRLMHMAAAAERDDALATLERERRFRADADREAAA